MSIADLTNSSAAVVVATVGETTAAERDDGRIETLVTLRVHEVLSGTVDGDRLVLHEMGGEIDGRVEVVFGVPQYTSGSLVTVFLRRTARGTWQTNHMMLGKFDVGSDGDGELAAAQSVPPGTTLLVDGAAAWRDHLLFSELRAAIAAAAGEPVAPPSPQTNETYAGFTLQPNAPLLPGRFFQPDSGLPLSFLIDQRGDSILGLDAARTAVNQAFGAWNEVDGATITLEDGGLTGDVSAPCPLPGETEGIHKVRFDDPDDEIADPVGCSGTLAVGGFCSTTQESKRVAGNDFHIATRALVTFADNWQGCEQWTPCNVAEVATHEVGHAIGLGHSSTNPNESNGTLKDATMYFLAHFDGRCAALRNDDRAGARFIYPAAAPPTILSESPLPEAVANQPYRIGLRVGGGTPPYSWAEIDAGCPDLGLTLRNDGTLEGNIPNAVGESCIDAFVADANGNSHTKRLAIPLVATPTGPTVTPFPTNTPDVTEAPTPTPTRTIPMNRPCVGDCNEDGSVSIGELIRGVGIALGRQLLGTCPSFDRDGNASVSIGELIQAVNAALAGCTEPG